MMPSEQSSQAASVEQRWELWLGMEAQFWLK
jgi:hypothetical protein